MMGTAEDSQINGACVLPKEIYLRIGILLEGCQNTIPY